MASRAMARCCPSMMTSRTLFVLSLSRTKIVLGGHALDDRVFELECLGPNRTGADHFRQRRVPGRYRPCSVSLWGTGYRGPQHPSWNGRTTTTIGGKELDRVARSGVQQVGDEFGGHANVVDVSLHDFVEAQGLEVEDFPNRLQLAKHALV